MNVDKLQFIDLDLPSGKLWATENVKDENGNEAYLTFNEAVETYGKNLPSKEDWKELFDNSTCNWNKERKGYDVVGPNGNSIFLPAAGYRYGVSWYLVGRHGYYWSSSVNHEFSAYNVYAYSVYFRSSGLYPDDDNYPDNGFSVRLCK